MSRGRYIILDLVGLSILETDIPEEIKECHSPEYADLDQLLCGAKGYLDVYRKDAWDAYILYLKNWASTHADHKYVGDVPDDYIYFCDNNFFGKEKSDEQD